ncbi:hypothetical protein ACFSL6_06765 [Paenibacillus thailandensis]|uniref:Uncharacterized protein n=1 Tax=Paenibacillus thailandensis TaxID=393250 RepID=A0ABW5R2D4_9BACL
MKASGSYAPSGCESPSGFSYVLRIEAWRGKSDLKLTHTIINQGTDAEMTDLGLEWRVSHPAGYSLGHTEGFAMPFATVDGVVQGVLSESFDDCIVG